MPTGLTRRTLKDGWKKRGSVHHSHNANKSVIFVVLAADLRHFVRPAVCQTCKNINRLACRFGYIGKVLLAAWLIALAAIRRSHTFSARLLCTKQGAEKEDQRSVTRAVLISAVSLLSPPASFHAPPQASLRTCVSSSASSCYHSLWLEECVPPLTNAFSHSVPRCEDYRYLACTCCLGARVFRAVCHVCVNELVMPLRKHNKQTHS